MAAADSSPSQPANTATSAAASTSARVIPWVARLAWVAVAVVGGSAIEAAVNDRSSGVRWLSAMGGWVVFAAVAVCLLVPSVLSLTISRVVSPLAVAAAGVSAFAGAPATDTALLLVPAIIAVAAIFTADVGRWMVQASAYGDEHRLPLRSPAATGAAAVVSWAVWATAVLAGPLLVAAGNLVAGIPVAILAVAATIFVGPNWHRLSRRWLVLVPAGLVVHDPIVLADTLMVRTDQLIGIGLAGADTEAADLTGPASGYALQVGTNDTVSTVFAFTPSGPNGKAIHMTGFLVAPSRPGEALRIATARRMPVR